TLPNGLTTIGESAFFYCENLQSVTIPATVTSIGESAFAMLGTRPDVCCRATTPPTAAADAFNYSTARGTLHVPVGCVDAYRNAQGWKEFKNIVEFEEIDESEWYLITDNNEQFKMSTVGMLVAADDSPYFSVLDLQGNVLAEDVLRVHFLKMDPASVKNIMVDEPQNMLKRYVNNQLTLVGARGTVNIYSVSGMKVASTHAMGQETVIDVSALPTGIYIIKCGKQSFKFNKK
ncbi:MAG: leucine-rich repeat protein, partial [Prevotella sp.]|nr:leucine-rich repeat protein [Prevotella sp.]